MKKYTTSFVLLMTLLTCSASALWARPVKTAPLGGADLAGGQLYGLVAGSQQATLAFRMPGTLIELPFEEGASVKKGDLVARISGEDYNAQASQAAAGVAVAQAQLDQANRELARYQPLHEAGAISDSQYEQVTTGVAMAKAGLANAKAQASRAGYATRDTALTAPFDGVVASRPGTLHSSVVPGQPVIVIENTATWQVETPLSAADRAAFKLGQRATVKVTTLPSVTFDAELTNLASRAKQGTQTWMATWTLKGGHEALLPGTSATVQPLRDGDGALAVPASALMSDASGTAIWLVRDGKAHRTAVTVTGFDAQGRALLAPTGLKAGDRAVTAGVSELREGDALEELAP